MVRAIRQDSGCTVIMISHSMDEVAHLVDRVLVMNQGQIVMQGTPREIFERSEELRL
jgi:energy-coupling factor transport system ATP-binding protein